MKLKVKQKYQIKDIYFQKKDNKLLMNQDYANLDLSVICCLFFLIEYQKIINLLDNTSNQPFKFRTKKLG